MTITSLIYDQHPEDGLSLYELQFMDWFRSAKPRDKHIYYSGIHLSESLASIKIRRLAWKYAIKGKIYLVQKRNANYFDYIAIKSSDPPCIRAIPMDYAEMQQRNRGI